MSRRLRHSVLLHMNIHTKSMTDMCSYSSPTGRQIYGALDAQCALVDFVAKLPSLHSASRSLTPLFEATVGIARQLIDRQELIQSYVEGESDSLTLPSESGESLVWVLGSA